MTARGYTDQPAISTRITIDGRSWRVALHDGIDCSATLDFDGPQPRVFSADRATAEPMRRDGFVGSIRLGGPVNVDVVHLTPHCSGTHTETVAHVADLGDTVARCAPLHPVPACLVTVPTRAGETVVEETPQHAALDDRVLAAQDLEEALDPIPAPFRTGVVLREGPRGARNPARVWKAADTPYLTERAAAVLARLGVEHLVVEWPSIDRLEDGGALTAHRAFWGVRGDSVDRPGSTITELAVIPPGTPDGLYLLGLLPPAFELDAAPSRPVLYPVTPIVQDHARVTR